jgi:hypothetical protein
MKLKLRPRGVSPALAIALLALFISLTGTAVAAGVVVPLAKRALVADNAKKLGGKTAVQVAALAPRRAPNVVVKTAPWSLAAGAEQDFTTTCDAGKAVTGGYDNPVGAALAFDTRPTADGGGWMLFLSASSSAAASGTLFVVCVS